MSIESLLTLDECERILRAGIASVDGSDKAFDQFPIQSQVQALQGVIGVVRGLEALGYTIDPPAKRVSS